MRRFLLKKLGNFLAVAGGLVLFIFILFMTLPSPEQIMMGQRGEKATRDAIMKEIGLDRPKTVQFAWYVNDLSPISIYGNESPKLKRISGFRVLALSGKSLVIKWPYLRESFISRQSVSGIIMGSLAGTAVLAVSALLIAILIGIPLGVYAARRQGSFADNAITGLSTIGISVPSFFSAMLFAWIFGFLLQKYTGLSMVGSLWEIDELGEGRHLALKNLILPAISLGIRPLSVFIQLTRNTMVEIMQLDYIRTARAKGLSERAIVWKHAFPNAINPLVTSVGGWLSSLLAGAFFTEYIFNWKGIGKVTIEALQQSDLPLIMGTVLFTACLFFIINALTELLYIRLNPRARNE